MKKPSSFDRLRKTDKDRPSAHQRGYNYQWKKTREGWLRNHPYCAGCERHGRVRLATVVDHIKDHKGNKELFWDRKNWQSLCVPCHASKTFSKNGIEQGFDQEGSPIDEHDGFYQKRI